MLCDVQIQTLILNETGRFYEYYSFFSQPLSSFSRTPNLKKQRTRRRIAEVRRHIRCCFRRRSLSFAYPLVSVFFDYIKERGTLRTQSRRLTFPTFEGATFGSSSILPFLCIRHRSSVVNLGHSVGHLGLHLHHKVWFFWLFPYISIINSKVHRTYIVFQPACPSHLSQNWK